MDPNHPLPGAYWKALKLFEAAGFIGDVDLLKAAAKDLDSEGRVEEVLYGYRDISNQTVLHFASVGGKTDVCKYLIEEVKLDVNARDANGETSLINATAWGHFATAKYLLQMGANPDLANKKTFSPLHYAAYKGDDEMLHLLHSEGANVDPLSLIGSPLQMAASKANEKAVKILLDNGSNPNLFFPHVETPLVASILAKSLCCLEHLIKAGANPIALSGSVAPLGVAASEGEVEMVQCLLEAGAIPDVTNKYGLTAMELAALKGNQRIVQILYPVTSKISTYPDWSIHGIMKDASSELARKQLGAHTKNFVQMKMEGDKAFKDKDYDTAIDLYTKYLEGDAWSALSRRSICLAFLNSEYAIIDAYDSIKLRPNEASTYIRAGTALTILGNFDLATDVFFDGLKRFPQHILLLRAFKEAGGLKVKMQKQKSNQLRM